MYAQYNSHVSRQHRQEIYYVNCDKLYLHSTIRPVGRGGACAPPFQIEI